MLKTRSIVTLAVAGVVAALPIAGCESMVPPSRAGPDASSPATPAATVTATLTTAPATPPPTPGDPRPVVMSTGVPAIVACEGPADRTLRLTHLSDTVAYGYDAELTPFSELEYTGDEGSPKSPSRHLVACDLATGIVTRLEGPVGTKVFIVDFDRDRLLLNGREVQPDPWLLDVTTGDLTPLKEFADRAVLPVAIDAYEVVGEQTLESLEYQIQPAMLDLWPGGWGFRVLTPYEIGVSAQRLRPIDIENHIIVGLVSDDSPADLPAVWIHRLGGPTGMAAPVLPEAFRGLLATPTGFDGRTVVGYGFRKPPYGPKQPFAWGLGDADITWLPLPEDQKGGVPWDIDGGRVVGMTSGTNEADISEWHSENRGIVWDLASGEFLDLGTGPPELSGTLATEASLSPQSLAVDLYGNRVLGFLGEGCTEVGGESSYCSAAGFGGTSVVWDIGDWLASIAP
jgi:hypothetical protein